MPETKIFRHALVCCLTGLLLASTGCSAINFRISGTPACNLPPQCLAIPKRGLVPIDVNKLSQRPPDVYRLAPGDIIGIYIPGVIPYQDPLADPAPPPIYYPPAGSDLPPSMGLPFAVLESGHVIVPAIQPVDVMGLTVEEASARIRDAYIEKQIIRDENTIPLVTLFKPRTYSVTVVREDTGGETNDKSANGATISLPAYKNDVLHALMETGGLPGLKARNEVRIYRGGAQRLGLNHQAGEVITAEEFERLNEYATTHQEMVDGPETIIPLRIYQGTQIEIPQQDIILNTGDIVYISNRDTEVFYTTGLLPGGEHQLPRDYDIDIFEAMSIAGYSYGASASGGGRGMMPATGITPTQLFVLRERPDGTEYTIKVDLEKAIAEDCERILVKPGDKLLLRYSPLEETMNFGVFAFFTYGIRELFR